jgi:hypothetical protein
MCLDLYKEYGTTMAGLKVQLMFHLLNLYKWLVLYFLLLYNRAVVILCRH